MIITTTIIIIIVIIMIIIPEVVSPQATHAELSLKDAKLGKHAWHLKPLQKPD